MLNIQHLSHTCWNKAPIYVAVFSLCSTGETLKCLGGTLARGWAAGVSSQSSLHFCTLAKYGLIFFFFFYHWKNTKLNPCCAWHFTSSYQNKTGNSRGWNYSFSLDTVVLLTANVLHVTQVVKILLTPVENTKYYGSIYEQDAVFESIADGKVRTPCGKAVYL